MVAIMPYNRNQHLIRTISSLFFTIIIASSAVAAKTPGRPPARIVTAPLIERRIAPQIPLTGSVVAEHESRVAAEIAGRVLKAPPREGVFVEKGALLCQLDDKLLQYSLKVAEQEIETASILLEKGKLDFERVKPVFASQATSKQAYDNRLFKLKEFEAKLAVAQVKRDRMKVEIEKKTIRAPFSGVIAERLLEIGEWVATGDVVCRLIDLDQLAARIQVPARYLPFIDKNSTLTIHIGPDKMTLKGKFNRIIPSGSLKTRTFPLYLDLPPKSGLLPGFDLEVMLPTGKPKTALLAPRAAIVRKAGTTYLVAIPENQAEIIPVKVLGYDTDYAVISPLKQQLKAGQPVVIRGNERLRPGQDVTIIPAAGEQKP
jgi:RND family efflux transporter MFP subunit